MSSFLGTSPIAGKTQILVVEDEPALLSVVCRHFRAAGYDPIEAGDGEQAISLYRAMSPDLVVTDMQLPGMSGLELLREVKKGPIQPIVMIMTGFGNEEMVLDALRGGATNYFKKPFDMKELLDSVRSVLRFRTDPDIIRLYAPSVVSESREYAFRTSDSDISTVIAQIVMNLPLISDGTTLMNLRIGVQEMVSNAVEHGNLGISYEEKSRSLSEGTYGDLIDARLSDPTNAEKLIHVASHLSPDEFRLSVEDEGDGFDWHSVPDPSTEALYMFNGRGIFMTKIHYDEVNYNEKGNKVTIIKYRAT